jgi:hypothetical protein
VCDVLIGTISGYGLADVQCWVNSLDSCGFQGRKVVLACNAPRAVIEGLAGRGYEVVTYGIDSTSGDACYPIAGFTDEDASAERFYLMWKYLASRDTQFRYVISVDVRDAVFQCDPSKWLSSSLEHHELIVSSEALRYEDEEWNSANLQENFGPEIHRHMCRRTIWNAGAIAGTARCFQDLCLNVHLLCRASRTPYSDQAALNIVLSMQPYERVTKFTPSGGGWACHAGTFGDPAVAYRNRPNLLEPGPVFEGEYVSTNSGARYCIVHQYDRVPDWRSALLAKYGGLRAEAPQSDRS